MKKIVIDARELRTTTGRYVERLLHYLQDIDNDHEYIVLLKPKDIEGWVPKNKHFTKIACPYKEFTFSEQTKLLGQINKLESDLVFFPMVQQPVLYRGRTVTTIQDLTGCRFRNPTKNWLVFTLKQWVYKVVNLYVPHKSTLLITPTNFVKQDIAQFAHVNPDKITTTYEAADPLPHSPEKLSFSSNLKKSNFIMYLGRPLPHKNLWRLVQAYALLKKTHPDLKLVLAGKKDDMYGLIEDKAKRADIGGITFTGFVSDNELRWLYEHCAAYIFPSLSEGFGLPALEAMMHGAPVVSSNATCLPEVYGDAAVYFDPLNIEDMSTKIAAVIDDEELRQSLIKKGHKQAASYSWERMAQQTLDVFNRALDA